MENTSTIWPVSIETTGFQESVTLLEKEVISNKLSLFRFSHGFKGVVGTFKFASERLASIYNVSLNLVSLFFRNSWTEWELS